MEEYDMRIKLLKPKRNSIKREIASLTTFLETYNKGEQFVELQMRSNRLNLVFGKFDQICDEINALEESDDNNTEKDQILTKYFVTSSKAQELIGEVLNQNNTDAGSVSGSRASTNSRKRKIKLPPAKIPTFSGGHSNWLSFKHQFMSLVHDDEDLTDKDKFNLLQGACEGDAFKKIKGFLNADTDYTQAWDVLIKAYESKRALISEHLSNILNMPKENTDDYKTLENLIDTARLSMMSLANLGAQQSPEIVVKIIEEKLTPETRANWERECERSEFPTFEKLHEFLYKAAALRSMQKSRYSNSKNYHGPPTKVRKTDHISNLPLHSSQLQENV